MPNGSRFRYHTAQREAIETLIYLHEVKGVRSRTNLLLTYAKGHKIALPTYDEFARYAIKMGTGSGKTKVMALAMAWVPMSSRVEWAGSAESSSEAAKARPNW